MQTVIVYKFEGWNTDAGVNQVGLSYSTRERINRIKQVVLEDSALEVDAAYVNADGIYLPKLS